MDSTQFQPLPPEVERRIEALRGLTGAARTEALAALYRDFPEHAATLAARLAPDRSQVVTGGPALASVAERLRSLAERAAAARRYELHGEVARGGMGAILRAFDQDLGRTLAMKVILGHGDGDGSCGVVDPQVLDRFVEEAQITGQLDHPGVVPVHELGLDDKGRVYFTMRLVKGITAQEVFGLARDRAEGWTPTRALEVLLKVCDTLAYAHSKGVVHRDLKPSNVMVGKFGEVYVMDWGLAKVLGKADAHDLRIRPPESTLQSRVRTDRSKEHESDPDTALRTMDGAIVGTPCYMPPEQAHGHVGDVGVRSDVYAAGAMLYTLLTGTQPYIRPGSKTSPYMILEWVREGPPAAVHKLEPKAPAELVAVCERAMARDMRARYAGMTELADDLRAYLEGRVVRAYRTGARAELVVWMRRNRGMAGGLLAAVVALVAGGAGAIVYAGRAEVANREAKDAQVVAVRERDVAKEERGKAEAARNKAEQALADLKAEQEQKEEADRRTVRAQTEARKAERKAERDAERAFAAQLARVTRVLEDAILLERLRGVDLFLENHVVGSAARPSPGPELATAEADLARLRAQARQWTDWPVWEKFLQGCGSLVQGRPSAVAELTDALNICNSEKSPILYAALQRAMAAAHCQVGSGTAGLAAIELMESVGNGLAPSPVRPGGRAGSAEDWFATNQPAKLGWISRNRREADWIKVAARQGWASPAPAEKGATKARVRTPQEVLRDEFASLGGTDDRGSPELAAHLRRTVGLAGAAIEVLRSTQPESTTLRAAQVLEGARTWLAVHRPQHALELLDQHLRAFPAGHLFLPQLRLIHELRATCYETLGEEELALGALLDAVRVTPNADAASLQRLSVRRGDVLRRAGRATQALAAYAQREGDPLDVNLAGMPPDTCLRVAETAAVLGRASLAAEARQQARAAAEGAPVSMRIDVLLRDSQDLLAQGLAAEAAKGLERVDSLAEGAKDSWLQARVRVHAAAVAVANDRGRAALAELDRAARSLGQWLSDYGRFAGEPLDAARVEVLEELGRVAIGVLFDLAGSLRAEDLSAVWRILETFRAPVAVAFGARPLTLRASGLSQGDYEMARARWLWSGAGTIGIDLQKKEGRLRSQWPSYVGAVLPRVATLAEVRQALPETTALVVLGASGERAVAFVLTRSGSSLVPLRRPDGAVADGSPAALDRWGAEFLAPILACGALADRSKVRRLLIAPVDALQAVPFEWCPTTVPGAVVDAERQPLMLQWEVAYVPSGTAWFDHSSSLARRRRNIAEVGLVLHGDVAGDPSAQPWLVGALSPLCAKLLDLPGPAATGHALWQAAGGARAIGLSLPIESCPGPSMLAALQVAGPPLETGTSKGSPHALDARLMPQDLRDLAANADLAVVRITGSASGLPGEAAALSGFARGLWSGGAGAVVTVAAASPDEPAADLVKVLSAALRRGEEPVTSWCEAARQALRRGVPSASLHGLRLWSVSR